MVGSITVLIAIVAVFLAYNANTGLPFVPTYRVSVLVPDAASLLPGNEVRIGGVRVGQVESTEPVQSANDCSDPSGPVTPGATCAKLDLKLDASAKPLPVDSTVIIRARSALGLKYLEIQKGNSTEGFPEGAVLHLSHARPQPVEFDQVLNMFDTPTRLAIRHNLLEFGDALAGRGIDLNQGIGELRPLVTRLQPVMHNLSSPSTELGRFFRALEATAAEVAPVGEIQGNMFAALDTTFGALSGVARPFIQETISRTPRTFDVAVQAFPQLRPFFHDSAVLFRDLGPGAQALKTSTPTIASALQIGTPVLARSPTLNRQLPPTARALLKLNNNGRKGVEKLTQSNELLGPTLNFVTPAQTVCNYGTLFFRNLSSVVSIGDGLGTWQRFINFDLEQPRDPITGDLVSSGPNNEGMPSSAPANGGGPVADRNFLHVNPYPNTAAPGQTHECEAGNEPYLIGQQVIGNAPGNQGTVTEDQQP
jgi:ABC-type transporter Mla subunit MlaD